MTTPLTAIPVRTRVFEPGMELVSFMADHLSGKVSDGDVVAITSKIVSVAEGRLIPASQITKSELIHRESDLVLCETSHNVTLTITQGLLIPSAGIDESNSQQGHFIIYPQDPFLSAQKIHAELRNRLGLSKLGVIITDSRTQPLRRGVVGTALSHWGFEATRSLVGQKDLFGRALKMTSVNIVDSLAVAAVLVMGEAAEQQPLAIVRAPNLIFQEVSSREDVQVTVDQDLYRPLLLGKKP